MLLTIWLCLIAYHVLAHSEVDSLSIVFAWMDTIRPLRNFHFWMKEIFLCWKCILFLTVETIWNEGLVSLNSRSLKVVTKKQNKVQQRKIISFKKWTFLEGRKIRPYSQNFFSSSRWTLIAFEILVRRTPASHSVNQPLTMVSNWLSHWFFCFADKKRNNIDTFIEREQSNLKIVLPLFQTKPNGFQNYTVHLLNLSIVFSSCFDVQTMTSRKYVDNITFNLNKYKLTVLGKLFENFRLPTTFWSAAQTLHNLLTFTLLKAFVDRR